jgi:hypothetical protein
LCGQNRAVREDCLLAAPGVDSEPRDFGEAMNSENYSAISPRTVGSLRGAVLELLRFWIAWRKYLCQVRFHVSDRKPAKKRVKKIFSCAAGFLLRSWNQQGIFITNYGGE